MPRACYIQSLTMLTHPHIMRLHVLSWKQRHSAAQQGLFSSTTESDSMHDNTQQSTAWQCVFVHACPKHKAGEGRVRGYCPALGRSQQCAQCLHQTINIPGYGLFFGSQCQTQSDLCFEHITDAPFCAETGFALTTPHSHKKGGHCAVSHE